MEFLHLPSELLLSVAEQLEQEVDINSLSQTCRYLYTNLNNYLYRRHVRESGGRSMIWAAREGRVSTVRHLLAQGANPDILDHERQTPLGVAARHGRSGVVKLLLGVNGIALNSGVDRESFTPLLFAAYNGHAAVVKLLLMTDGVDLDAPTKKGNVLLWASRRGHEEIVRLLLATGKVNTGFCDPGQRTPLWYAANSGHDAAVKMLLAEDKGAPDVTGIPSRLDRFFGEPLLRAAMNGHVEVVRLLLATGKVDPNYEDYSRRTALECAITSGQVAISKLLLDTELVNPNGKDRFNLLPLAAFFGHIKSALLLLEKGAQVDGANNHGRTALHHAARQGSLEVVQLLIDQGAAVEAKDTFSETPLHWAVLSGRMGVTEVLLREGAQIEAARAKDGWRPMHLAAFRGWIDIISLLLEYGAQIDCGDIVNGTPLAQAAERAHFETIKLLLEKGADPKAEDMYGWTPLRRSASYGKPRAVQLLLGRTKPVPSREEYRELLQLAAAMGRMGLVRLLNGMRNKVGVESKDLLQALQIACLNGHFRTVKYFLKGGTDPGEVDEHGWTAKFCNSQSIRGSERIERLLARYNPQAPSLCTPLPPTSWSEGDKSPLLTLAENDTRVDYIGSMQGEYAPSACVRANHPISLLDGDFYFEITVLNAGTTGTIAMGLCCGSAFLDVLPGHRFSSTGLHSNGNYCKGDVLPTFIREPYGTGDIIGCRILTGGRLQLSKNGTPMDAVTNINHGKLYPFVGIASPGGSIKVNFGQEPFQTVG